MTQPNIGARATLLHQGKYFRATLGTTSPLAKLASRIGIVEVGKQWTLSGFKRLSEQGRLQEISREQAMRLLDMIPKAPKVQGYAGTHKGKMIQHYMEPEVVDQIRRLSKQRKVSAAQLMREWIRTGLALAQDQENAK